MSEAELIVRLLLSAALGSLIGLERELAQKIAGLRTHSLVCFGACLFTVTSIYYFSVDPARIASAIVAGIGFIGAGAIVAQRGNIRGVTTAASLWAVAGIGLVIGVGGYLIGLAATAIALVILESRKLEKSKSKDY